MTAEESGIRIVRGSGYINKEVKLVFVSKGAMKITGILKKTKHWDFKMVVR